MEYDGFINVYYLKGNNQQGYAIIINDNLTFMIVDSANIGQHGCSITLPFKKGDKLKTNVSFGQQGKYKVTYYKLRDYSNR